ncbi:LysR family transcriptional regulator [Paraburkholderia phosphatilytica]|uniref:LysR family transcriptional regulator n=1 Tax=Paraburkholderia phosphatilytica TaxID=2282883 RepID=UPI000E49793D|nr:LysR family transcriptional regulator [Paraburkholderia phosphatilytica]
MNVSLHQLKVFIAVAREQSFTRAAREFDLTQSAVSRCIRELEDAIDLKLFDRTTRQVELTSAGATLERRIGRLLDEIELTLLEGRAAHEGHTGLVIVASNPVLSTGWVPEALARCAKVSPALVVSMRDLSQSAVMTAVAQGEVDFGLVSGAEPLPADGCIDGLRAQPLFATPLCAVLPATHPLAKETTLTWAALESMPLVTLNEDSGVRAAVARALGSGRARGRPLQALGHVAAVWRMVELQLGVGILPVGEHWPDVPEHLVVRPLTPDQRIVTQLVRRRNRSLRPNAETVWTQFASVDEAMDSAMTGAITPEPVVTEIGRPKGLARVA